MTGLADNPGRNWLMIGIRCSLAGLLGFALVTKLVDPSQLLVPLDSGLGFGQRGAAVGYIAVVAALLACIGLLMLRRGATGVLATGVFFVQRFCNDSAVRHTDTAPCDTSLSLKTSAHPHPDPSGQVNGGMMTVAPVLSVP